MGTKRQALPPASLNNGSAEGCTDNKPLPTLPRALIHQAISADTPSGGISARGTDCPCRPGVLPGAGFTEPTAAAETRVKRHQRMISPAVHLRQSPSAPRWHHCEPARTAITSPAPHLRRNYKPQTKWLTGATETTARPGKHSGPAPAKHKLKLVGAIAGETPKAHENPHWQSTGAPTGAPAIPPINIRCRRGSFKP